LPEAVASCLAQTYPSIEVVVVDDGSADGTREMVTARLLGDWAGKVVYQHKENGGVSSARNLGLSLARGEYVQFLDSDDVLLPDKIGRQIASFQSAVEPVDCCMCYGRLGDRASGWEAARRIGELCPDVATYIRRQCERSIHIMHTAAPLWRREFLTLADGWREALMVAEEWEYYIRLLALRPRLTSVPDDLFFVRAHEGDQLSKNFQSLRHSLSFYHAVRAVHESLEPTPFCSPEVRAGLLMRARTTYINMLRCGDAAIIRDYEDWLLKQARSVPGRGVVGAVRLRQTIGRKLLLALFDLQSRRRG
jgi:glycosyltransferase involved in cell wall biosynthesis